MDHLDSEMIHESDIQVSPPETPELLPSVSVIIPARNERARIGRQLGALSKQHYRGAVEVIVADNGSTDGTREFVAALAWSRHQSLRAVDASRSPGINVARNIGVEHSTGDLVLLCDADDEIQPGWIEHMASALSNHDVVGGQLQDAFETPGGWEITGSVYGLRNSYGIPFGAGASLGFRRSVWDRVGGFDEAFLYGFDEVDFCLRAHKQGFTIGGAHNALTIYRVRQAKRDLFRQYYLYGKGDALIRHKHAETLAGVGRLRIRHEVRTLCTLPSVLIRGGFHRPMSRDTLTNVALIIGRLSTVAGRRPRCSWAI